MKPIKYFPVLLILSAFISTPAFSQDAPITWGDIPRPDLEMKSYAPDSNASAVILCDYGESHYNDLLNIEYTRHLRVKILTPKGYTFGTQTVRLYTNNRIETLHDVEGITYSLDERGNVVKAELQQKDIFREKIDENNSRFRFTLPGLKPGCVLEIRYIIESKDPWLMRDWIFQRSEPTRWSEYRIRFPKAFLYNAVIRGYERYVINDVRDTIQVFVGDAQEVLSETGSQAVQRRWAVKNAPAIRDEPYMTTTDDYVNRVYIQLASYKIAARMMGTNQLERQIQKNYLKSWPGLIKELLDDEYFGDKIDKTSKVKKLAAEVTAHAVSPVEKMAAIYYWVASNIVWSGNENVFGFQKVNDVLESKKGSSADINFLLLSLLKSANIECDPVILSTRENGKIQEWYPLLSQFNYVIARAEIDSLVYYLDATDPLRPIGLLPSKILNTRGLVVDKNGQEWVTFSTPKHFTNNSFAMVTLKEDGTFNGTIDDTYKEYAALANRRNLKDKKDKDILKEALSIEQFGITVDSAHIDNKDSIDLPLKYKAWISSSEYVQGTGDVLYINPHFLHRSTENPFKTEVRKFPVDYSYQRSYTASLLLTIPEDFEVKETLQNRMLTLGSNLATYKRLVQVDGNQIQLISDLEIRSTVITPEYYAKLKDFYAQIVSAESEQLVLAHVKKPAVSASPAVPPVPVKGKGKK